MAGRGTDIVLGGNAEYMAKNQMKKMGISDDLISESTSFTETEDEEILNARKTYQELYNKYKESIKKEAEEVKEAGGLYIMGTERHESRRIDNQLRGRSGRQGDPGKSCFYLSFEDDLMRLFGGERMQNTMDKFKIEEDVPIENKMFSNAIESAQKKVEGRNFAIRKNVLQFDDVMNRQREIIYSQRDSVLNGDNIKEQILTMVKDAIKSTVSKYLPKESSKDDWNLEGLRDYYLNWLIGPDDLQFTPSEIENLEPDFLIDEIYKKAEELYEKREENFGSELTREIERVVLLKNVDQQWMDHIDAMEELKRGIRLRAYGQRDPVVEYRIEGFDMFDEMIASIREDTARMMLTFQLKKNEDAPQREQVAKPTTTNAVGDDAQGTTIKKDKKIGRNDPCPCGSGKKYKKCCGMDK